MKTILFTFAWLLSLGIQAQDTKYSASQELRGNGRIVLETRQVAPFTEIQTQQFPANITIDKG